MRGLRAPAVLTVALVVAALGALAAPAGAATVVVDTLGTGDYTAIQPALTAAAEDDTVLVLPGTYRGVRNRNLTFGTKNLVLVGRGGADSTIIDCQNTPATRGIYFSGGQDSTCIVDGFTIRNGHLTSAPQPGAGVRCESASPKLLNLIIKHNVNTTGFGGGLHCNNFASPVVRNVVFDGNYGYTGGGLYCNTNSMPVLHGVTFVDNYAVDEGGGACCLMGCDAMFIDVVFDGNTTAGNGGGFACFRSSPAIANAVFLENTAVDSGGAFYIQRWSYPIIANCTMSGNSASAGGAVCISESCDPTIVQSIIAFTGPGASTVRCDVGNPTITHCMVFGNAPGDSLCGQHDHNAFLDPLFCNVTTGDLTLASNSPCMPGQAGNPSDELVGALGSGCTSSPVRMTSWGRIKCLYR
jgi:predicted outer membrane repeat protein